MNTEEKKLFEDSLEVIKELQEKVNELEEIINDMKKDTRQYTQTEVHTGKVVFRGEVYNKAGTKVIN
jgi:archaellum component FlaC